MAHRSVISRRDIGEGREIDVYVHLTVNPVHQALNAQKHPVGRCVSKNTLKTRINKCSDRLSGPNYARVPLRASAVVFEQTLSEYPIQDH